jgi:hypothetical protein
MLPLVGRLLPDFGPVFERYANDLKREAERLEAYARYPRSRRRQPRQAFR